MTLSDLRQHDLFEDTPFTLRENKDARIDKLALTHDQKARLKNLFKQHPEREKMIDWNRKDLTWEDFAEVIAVVSNSEKKKQVKRGTASLDTLTLGKDYDIVKREGTRTLYRIYTYQASCLIASDAVEPALRSVVPYWAQNEENEWYAVIDEDDRAPGAHWCISMKKTIKHWNEYDCYKFYFCVDTSRHDNLAKIALFNEKYGRPVGFEKCSIWNADDTEISYPDIKYGAEEIYMFLNSVGDIFEDRDSSVPTEGRDYLEETFGINVVQSQNLVEIKSNDVVALSYTYDLTEYQDSWFEDIELWLNVDEEVFAQHRDEVDNIYREVAKIQGIADDINGEAATFFVTNSVNIPLLCRAVLQAYDKLSEFPPILQEDHHMLGDMAEMSLKLYNKGKIIADGAKHIVDDGVGSQLFYVYSNNKGEERFVLRMLFKEPLLPGNKEYEDVRIGLQKRFLESQIRLGYEQATDAVTFEIHEGFIDLVLRGKKAEKKGFQMMNSVVREHRYTETYIKRGEPPLIIRV